MPPSTFIGLPLHPLIVHATVVIVPAAALTVLLAVMWPRFRRWAGYLPLALAATALVLDPLSTSSGENLQQAMAQSDSIAKHAQLAEGLLPWVALLFAAAAAPHVWRLVERRRGSRPGAPSALRWVPTAIAAVAVVAAVGTTVQVALIGHSGATSAWSDVANQ